MSRTVAPGSGIGTGPTQVLAAAALWGTVGPAQVLLGTPLPAAALGGWRLAVGALVLGVVVARAPAQLRGLLVPGARRWILLAAAATGLFQVAFLAAVERTGAATATAVALGVAPVATGGLAAVWLRDRPGRRWLVATAVAVVGCVLLLLPGAARPDPTGVLLAVLSGGCYGIYTVAASRLVRLSVDGTATAAVTLAIGALPALPWMLSDLPAVGQPSALVLILWLGVVATGLAYWLFMRGVRTTSAASVGTLSLAEPLVAVALGVGLLGERLDPLAGLGVVLLLGGLVGASTGRAGRSAPAVEPAPVTAAPAAAAPVGSAPQAGSARPGRDG